MEEEDLILISSEENSESESFSIREDRENERVRLNRFRERREGIEINNNFERIHFILNEDTFLKEQIEYCGETLGKALPTVIFIIASIVAMHKSKSREYCMISYKWMILLIMLYSILSLINSIIQILVRGFSRHYEGKNMKTVLIMDFIFQMCYLGILIAIAIMYFNKPSTCHEINFLETIIIFCFIVIGFLNFGKILLRFISIVIAFPIAVALFFITIRNRNNLEVDPNLIENLPIVMASQEHLTSCVICRIDIKENDALVILKCSEKHFFHERCIKSWLKQKQSCPICRSVDIF